MTENLRCRWKRLKNLLLPSFQSIDVVVRFKELNDEILLKVVGKFVDELKMSLTLKMCELAVSTKRVEIGLLLKKERTELMVHAPLDARWMSIWKKLLWTSCF